MLQHFVLVNLCQHLTVIEFQRCEGLKVLSTTLFVIYMLFINNWKQFTQIDISILRMVWPYFNIILKWCWQTSPGSHRDTTNTWTVGPGILFWHEDFIRCKGTCFKGRKNFNCKINRLKTNEQKVWTETSHFQISLQN